MATKVTDRDKGYRALMERLKAHGATVTVGVHENEGGKTDGDGTGPAGPTVLDVAKWNEFGTPTSPPRSFLAGWADERQKENEADMRKVGEAVIKGKIPSIDVGLERLGLKWVGDVKARIKAHIPPPNAESTIAKKGSSTPLIASSQLFNSILHKVEK